MKRDSKILVAVAILITILITTIIWLSSTVFLQLLIAFGLAFILNPAVQFLEKRQVGRILSILIVFFSAIIIFVTFAGFFVFSLSRELTNMQLNLPGYAKHLYDITPEPAKIYLGIETQEKLTIRLTETINQAKDLSPDYIKTVLEVARKAFSSTISLILALLGYLIIPVYLFYLLADLPKFDQLVESMIPERLRSAYRNKLEEVFKILSGFVKGQLSVCAILAVLYSTGLYFIGIDLAIVIGTLAGAAFIIPYVGTIIGIVLSVIMAALKFRDILHPLLCLGWFCLVQALEGSIITPKIVGDTIGLHPLVAIVALLIGGQIFGITGMLLAVPVTAVSQVFVRSLFSWYRKSDFYRAK